MARQLGARSTHAFRLMVAHSPCKLQIMRARAQTFRSRTPHGLRKRSQNGCLPSRSCPPSPFSSSFLLITHNFRSHQSQLPLAIRSIIKELYLNNHQSFAALIPNSIPIPNPNSSSHLTSSLLTFIPSHIRCPSRLVIKDSTTYHQSSKSTPKEVAITKNGFSRCDG